MATLQMPITIHMHPFTVMLLRVQKLLGQEMPSG